MPTHPAPARETTLGDLIHVVYESMLATYGDPDIASVATAAVVNEVLAGRARPETSKNAA